MSGEGAAASGRYRCLSALPHCGAGQGKVCPEATGDRGNYGEQSGRGERGERGQRSERSARPGTGSRRQPGQAERHREGESWRSRPTRLHALQPGFDAARQAMFCKGRQRQLGCLGNDLNFSPARDEEKRFLAVTFICRDATTCFLPKEKRSSCLSVLFYL